jgi:hypothetical protein
VNTADGARARMMLPYLREVGWEVTVAAMRPEQNPNQKDEMLLRTVPAETEVRHLGAWDEKWCRKLGFGHLSNRIFWPWRGAVLQLLRKKKYDLVFLSTTSFTVMAHGAYWLRKTGVPYVIDLHDPIHVPGGSYQKHNAPGGYWKYRLANLLNAWIEKRAFSRVAGVIATSRHYLETLQERYPHLRNVPMEAIPFGVPYRDLDILKGLNLRNRLFSKKEGEKNIFYAGRGGPDLHPALHALFSAAAELKKQNPAAAGKLRFVFVGTSYDPGGKGRRQVVPIAESHGVGELVKEDPNRASYFEVLQGIREADATLVLGSPQPDYTASKALLCAAAAPRVFAILHRESLPGKLLPKNPVVRAALFSQQPNEEQCREKIRNVIHSLASGAWPDVQEDQSDGGKEESAGAMTAQIVWMWRKVLEQR